MVNQVIAPNRESQQRHKNIASCAFNKWSSGTPKDTWTCMFTAALFTVAKRWKQPKCPSRDAWINKMWRTYIIEHYSVIKRNEVQIYVTSWMNLENIMLSERSQTRRTNTVWFHLCEIPRRSKFIETESRLEVSRMEEGMGSYYLMVPEFQFGVMEKFWK